MKKDPKLILLLIITFNYALLAESLPYRNVIYYSNWSVYSKFYPSSMDAKSISHVNFAFMDMDENGDLKLIDEYADFQVATIPELEGLSYGQPYAGVIGALVSLKIKNPHLKVGISVGGWGNSGSFHVVSNDVVKRKNFASNIAKFIDYLGFDFVDIDWEHPTFSREGCPGGPEDTESFTLLMQDLRNELDKLEKKNGKHYELSIAMSAELDVLPTIQYDKVLQIIDFLNLMTYDLAGSWNSYTSHQTPLYTNEKYNHQTMWAKNSADASIRYFEKTYGNTIDYKKILIGVAAYTRGWAGVKDDGLDKDNPGLFATATPNSVVGPDGTTDGSYQFGDIEKIKEQYDLIEYFDNTAKAAYYYSPTKGYFFTCDNEKSVSEKGKYVKEKGLGGLIMWMASQDTENKLKKTIFNTLNGENYNYPEQKLIFNYPSVTAKISTIDYGYEITIINNENIVETNTPLKYAELFQKSILFMKVYIQTKSGIQFSVRSGSGTVTNKNGIAIVDPTSNYDAKIISPGKSYTFSVGISGAPDIQDITSIKITQRIGISSDEFKEQTIYK